MQEIDLIKTKIKELYEKGEVVHVDVNSSRPKIHVNGAQALITGVYKNLFTLETVENDMKKIYSVQYADVLIGRVKIMEIEKAVN